MLLTLFTRLSEALSAAPQFALAAAFAWGVLSIVLSPCHLASIPLVVGFINGQKVATTGRAFVLSLLFSTGILVTISAIGLVTGLLGRMLGDIGATGNYLVAAVFLVVGLNLLEVLPLPFLERTEQPGVRQKGALAAFLLGLLFGIALGPCTFAFMAPMLGVALAVASTSLLFAISLIAAYAAGHCAVIVLAGTFTQTVQRYLNWTGKSRAAAVLRKACGVLVLLAGAYMIYQGVQR